MRLKCVAPCPSSAPPLLGADPPIPPPPPLSHRYIWLWITILITVGVHCANVYSAIVYGLAKGWTNTIYSKCAEANDCAVNISFNLLRWITIGCIIFSFLLVRHPFALGGAPGVRARARSRYNPRRCRAPMTDRH